MLVVTKEVDGKSLKNIQIARADLKGKIIDIEDTVDYSFNEKSMKTLDDGSKQWKPFQKVTINATDYGNSPTINVRVYLDLDDFLSISQQIVQRKAVSFKDFKGSKNDKYETGYEARVLEISSDPEAYSGKGSYKFSLGAGPGKVGDKGQVSLVGKPTKSIIMNLSLDEAARVFNYASNYFNNKQVAFLSKSWDVLYK